MRKAITNLQKSEIRLELTALGRDKVILSNEYDIFLIPVVSRHVGTGRGCGRSCGQSSSSQRIVGKQSSKLPKKYYLSDIPKFITEDDGFKRLFSGPERKKILQLNHPYRYALSKQLQNMKPEQVKASSMLNVRHNKFNRTMLDGLKINKKLLIRPLLIMKEVDA